MYLHPYQESSFWEVSDIAYEIKRLEHFKPDKIFAGLNICQSKYMPIKKFARTPLFTLPQTY